MSGLRFNEKRNKQHQKRPIYTKLTNICTTSSHADPQMRGNLNVRVLRAQAERLCVTAASENSQENLIVLLGEFISSYLSVVCSF